MHKRLETARLILTPLSATDTEVLHALWTTPEVSEYLWDGERIPYARTAEIVSRSRELFAAHGWGLWGARLPNENPLLGFAGYWHFHDPPELELLYGVAAGYWRQGYATELAQALIDYGFTDLGLDEIRASTDAGNTASVRVLEKLGFTYKRRTVVAGLDTLFYLATQDRSLPSIQ